MTDTSKPKAAAADPAAANASAPDDTVEPGDFAPDPAGDPDTAAQQGLPYSPHVADVLEFLNGELRPHLHSPQDGYDWHDTVTKLDDYSQELTDKLPADQPVIALKTGEVLRLENSAGWGYAGQVEGGVGTPGDEAAN